MGVETFVNIVFWLLYLGAGAIALGLVWVLVNALKTFDAEGGS